ncbi:HNH endonuclease [Paraburkholderia sp. RL17-380-BIE-A]|jgi:5-methylcytosine-specific restriction protein A|uniref:HNH endonuclease n=1 Tax=Paraburkholderia sp. RL17-380-BIE-A TaxID=3031630 RepID=UPI0038BD9091
MTTLQELKPTTKQLVRDITERLGIEMTTQYDWCFSNPDGPYLVNIWHDGMFEENDEIYFVDRASDWAEKNIDTATPVQLNRAAAVSALIHTAYYRKAPLHVAILDGIRRTVGIRETSEAHQRELDSVLWYPHHKDENRRIVVVRGKPQPQNIDPYAEEEEHQRQVKVPTARPPKKIEVSATAIYERDSEVVKAVKRRAADGHCELCGQEGFKTANGRYYLEAHHVIPLNCGGRDDIRNVVAICANDHRRAHFGEERHDLRDGLIWNVLASYYPEDEEFLEELDEKSRQLRHSDAAQRKLEDNRVES